MQSKGAIRLVVLLISLACIYQVFMAATRIQRRRQPIMRKSRSFYSENEGISGD